jgi:hypothetical protein
MNFGRLNKRQTWLGGLGLITVLAALWPVDEHNDVSIQVPEHAAKHHQTAHIEKPTVHFKPLQARDISDDELLPAIDNLFPSQSWTPPPPKVAPVVQQAPVAPPLPFVFAGRYVDGSITTAFLTEGTQMHRIKQGETINSTYRIDKIDATTITLTYLPLGSSQILPAGVSLP